MKKVIKLTESDIEDIIRRVISEQVQNTSKSFSLGNTFPSAEYKIRNSSEIDNAINQIKSIISKYPENTKFSVTVNAGESNVPNPPQFKEKGSLATARANEVLNYLKSKVSNIPNIELAQPNIVPPKTPWDPKKGKDAPEYTKEQFVNLILNIAGERTLSPIRKPYYGLANGSEYYIGFQDGSVYTLSKNDPNQMKLYAKIGNSAPFDNWRKNRRELDITCRQFPERCINIKYDYNKAIRIDNDEVVNQIVQKMQNEKLSAPQSATNQ